MLLLAHVQGDDIGLTVGGLAVINESFFLAVSFITCLLTWEDGKVGGYGEGVIPEKDKNITEELSDFSNQKIQ